MNEDKKIQHIANMASESEKSIERYLCSKVKECGGICAKYTNHGLTGMPDRVVLLPYGRTIWVELKSKGKKPNAQQRYRARQLDNMGFVVEVIDSKDKVDALLRDYGYEI